MKKNNLKRYLASLLAVLMLSQVTGIAPAVFADGIDAAPAVQAESDNTVAPELKVSSEPIEVLLKSDMTNEEVLDILADKLIVNKDAIDPQSLEWTYTCAVHGTYTGAFGKTYPTAGKMEATVPIAGRTDTNVKYNDIVTDATFVYPALQSNSYGEYTLYLNGQSVKIDMVKQYTAKLVLKTGASITYSMDAQVEKDAIVANVIDYEKSTLPEGTTASDFTVECKPLLIWKDIPDAKLDAGEDQDVRITFVGNDTYKESKSEVASINVAKATVKVSVTPITTIYAGNEIDRSTFYTLDPNDPELDVYIFFVGVNSNKQTCVNIKLSADQEKLINAISDAQIKYLKYAEADTIRGKLKEGITLGELKAILNSVITSDIVMGGLKLVGYDEAVKNIVAALDTLTSVSDDTVVAIGTPAHAGVYVATAIAVGKNYETGTGTGSLVVLKNWKGIKLAKNDLLNSGDKANTITVSQAEQLKAGNNLCILTKDGEALNSASAGSIHYWFTGVGKIYAKSEMPTAPGRYIVTASVRGGDFFALPKTFVFTIVEDPA